MGPFTVAVSRRSFLKYCSTIALLLGLSKEDGRSIAHAVEQAAEKPPVVWFEAQNCGGCLQSFLNSENPDAARLILEIISLRYSPELSSLSGSRLQAQAREAAKGGGMILLLEGSVPGAAGGRYCVVAEEAAADRTTASQFVKELGRDAGAVVAVGTCAAFGGIPASRRAGTGAAAASKIIAERKAVNISGCPPHPDWVVATLVHILLFGSIPARDSFNRPTLFYGKTVHDLCQRRAAFDEGRFAGSFADLEPGDDRCLLLLGCKGPVANADCPKRQWNGGLNWCVGAGAPCIGCTESEFYEGLSPVLARLPGITPPLGAGTRQTVDVIGKAVLGGTAAVIAGHAAVSGVSRLLEGRRKEQEALSGRLSGRIVVPPPDAAGPPKPPAVAPPPALEVPAPEAPEPEPPESAPATVEEQEYEDPEPEAADERQAESEDKGSRTPFGKRSGRSWLPFGKRKGRSDG